jgi:acetoin utilization deacetylase AcuC-like enzyme
MLYRQVAVPALHAFRPDVIIVSAGFDAHERDPLGGLRMTTEGFAVVSTRLLQAADDLCSGRIVFVTEGGYDTSALAECCQMLIERCDAGPVERAPAPLEGDTRRAEQTLEAFRRAHRRL